MENKKRFKLYISNRRINKEKSTNPLVHLKYRQLQELAIKLLLPANVKYKLLLALIIARTTNREDMVGLIMQELEQGRRIKLGEHKIEKRQGNTSTETHKEVTECINIPTQSGCATISAGPEMFGQESTIDNGSFSSSSAGNSNLSQASTISCDNVFDNLITDLESYCSSSTMSSFENNSQQGPSGLSALNEESWIWDNIV